MKITLHIAPTVEIQQTKNETLSFIKMRKKKAHMAVNNMILDLSYEYSSNTNINTF